MRRSLLPSAVPPPSTSSAAGAAAAAASENTAVIPLSKLSRARNSIAPRQPLAPVQQQVQQPVQQQLGHKRASAAFAVQDENQQRPTKLSRSSLAPSTAAPSSTRVGGAVAPSPAPLPSPSHATELSVDCIPGYDVRMLQGVGGQLLSFEEVRAMHPRYAMAKKKATVQPLQSHSAHAHLGSQVQSHPAVLAPLHSPAGSPSASGSGSSRAASHFTTTPDHTHGHGHGSGAHHHNQSLSHPSPTVCTRAAMDDIEAMFKDQSPAPSALVVTPGTRGGFAGAAGPPVPFSTRSLTKEIPPMHEGPAAGSGMGGGGGGLGGAFGLSATDYSRGRPSPVAFAVFTDEEMQTRNVASAAAAAQALQNSRTKGVGLCVFVDPDLENKPPAAAAAAPAAAAPAPSAPASSFGAARRQPLAARAPEPATALNDEEDEDDEDDDAYATNSSKSYPPLTPIAEVNESDMSHASSTSATPGLTGATGAQAQAAAFAAAQALARQQEEESAASAAAEELASQGILDAFDPAQRVAWINELGTLSSPLVTDLTAQPAPFSLASLASGAENQVEVGENLFQVSSVHPVLPDAAAWGTAGPEEKSLTLVCENLLEGGESSLRLGGVSELMEAHVSSALLSRLLANDPSSEPLIRSLFLLPTQAVVYEDACCIVAPVTPRGTMASLLSSYARAGARMDPRLAVYYCHELLKLLQILHVNQLLHNNLSVHTVWIRFDDDAGAWSDTWSAEGEGGWQGKGVALSHFGAALDRTLFPADTSFRCCNPRILASMSAMATVQGELGARSWTESVDLVGLCQIAWAMLFPGERMELQRDSATGSVSVRRAFPAGLLSDVMKPLFDTVLNFDFDPRNAQASADLLAQLLAHFETAISMDQPDGQTTIAQALKQLLQKQQLMMLNTSK